jgi:hypothetical protein
MKRTEKTETSRWHDDWTRDELIQEVERLEAQNAVLRTERDNAILPLEQVCEWRTPKLQHVMRR